MKGKGFTNIQIADLLRNIQAAYTVKEESRFKIMAYERAAVSIEHSTSEIKDIWDEGKLDEIPGVGKSIASHLDELFRTGKVKHFEKIFKPLPPAMFIFLKIPGVGPKTAYTLAKELKISQEKDCLEKLKKAAEDQEIRKIENFGEKSEMDILEGIDILKKGGLKTKRMLLPYADELAHEIIDYLKESEEVIAADPLGSLRRKMATIGDIDISVCTKNPKKVIEHLLAFKKIKDVLEKGEQSLVRVVLSGGQQVDIRFSGPESYGAMLQYFTGSKMHNIRLREYALRKGLSLSEYGIKKAKSEKRKAKNENLKLKTFSNEVSFYNELGLEWIPPEIREGTNEIEAAEKKQIPKLVEIGDIKGDLHIHSDFPIESSHDIGESTGISIIKKAIDLGYEYIGFSEHNPSVGNHSQKEIIELLKRKKEYFEQLIYSQEVQKYIRTNKLSIKVLNGLEVDIKPDGSLAIPEEAFNYLDYVILSIHSSFDLSKEKMTARILKALSNPKVKILGHPTGRLLDEREGYEVDWETVFDFCRKNGKILEISAWPNRLDLTDLLSREAVKNNVMLVINSDSHEVNQMANMEYGVAVAKRGWAEKINIINTLPFKKFSAILSST